MSTICWKKGITTMIRLRSIAILLGVCQMLSTCSLQAAIVWDDDATTPWWFNAANWDGDADGQLPGTTTTDTQINSGFNAAGEGVVYDPVIDPNFPPSGTFNWGSPQIIGPLYLGRASSTVNPAPENLLTIKGNLELQGAVNVGRSSGVDGTFTLGRIVQQSGKFFVPGADVTLGAPDTSRAGLGRGIYDYRGGTFHVDSSTGLRLSHGSNTTNGGTTQPTGASGYGKFIVHNPSTGGFVRAYQVSIASYAGISGATDNRDPDGIDRGVGIFEFHYENGGTRPFQVGANLSINNGFTSATGGTRSSRLGLTLNAPVTLTAGVPQNLGLFDVDFDQSDLLVGTITGTGDLNGDLIENNDRVFSNLAGNVHYREGDTISAVFGSTQYNWTISYTGNISWTDADNSVVSSITGPGTGTDVVLMGLSSVSVGIPGDFDGDSDVDGRDFLIWQRNTSVGNLSDWQTNYGTGTGPLSAVTAVPEPGSLALLAAAVLPLLGRRRG
jgi:hypothetical protein